MIDLGDDSPRDSLRMRKRALQVVNGRKREAVAPHFLQPFSRCMLCEDLMDLGDEGVSVGDAEGVVGVKRGSRPVGLIQEGRELAKLVVWWGELGEVMSEGGKEMWGDDKPFPAPIITQPSRVLKFCVVRRTKSLSEHDLGFENTDSQTW